MTSATPSASASSNATANRRESLSSLLRARAGARVITEYLDALGPAARLAEVLAITGRGVAALYEAVADAEPVSLEEFLPENERGTRIYEGRNSLPMFSRFQKRFQRGEGGVIVGYNHQSMGVFTGPGYFVVKPPTGEGEFGKELLFDYTLPPPFFPTGWPSYKPNEAGLSKLVYANMKDYCRRVAKGVVVGKAYKLGVDQKAWFSLTHV